MSELYKETFSYALHNNETDKWKMSHHRNIQCKVAIEKDIADNFGNNQLDTDGSAVIKEFGIERVAWVIAATIRIKDYDGRFSYDNKQWAKTVFPNKMLEEDTFIRNAFCIDSHPTLLDGYTNSIKKGLQRAS